MGNSKLRVVWIDNAKAIGIIAVFFGHLMEQMFLSYSLKAHLPFKLIYSFHMPLFFIISGFFAKKHEERLGNFLKIKFFSRIVPVILFSILSLPLYMIRVKNFDIKQISIQVSYLIFGIPAFNYVTWFLVCLFMVEIINFFVFPSVHNNRNKLIFCIFVFYVCGWLIPWLKQNVTQVLQLSQFWYIQQAFMAYSFYLFGYLIYKFDSIFERMSLYMNIVLGVVSASILFFTFNLNDGPFFQITQRVVIVASAIYGNFFLFPLTAIAGSLFTISISKLIPEGKVLTFLGRNTLILMGLNGMLLFLNKDLVKFSTNYISDSTLSVFILVSFLTLISIIWCAPVAFLLKKYLPRLVGEPSIKVSLGKA